MCSPLFTEYFAWIFHDFMSCYRCWRLHRLQAYYTRILISPNDFRVLHLPSAFSTFWIDLYFCLLGSLSWTVMNLICILQQTRSFNIDGFGEFRLHTAGCRQQLRGRRYRHIQCNEASTITLKTAKQGWYKRKIKIIYKKKDPSCTQQCWR